MASSLASCQTRSSTRRAQIPACAGRRDRLFEKQVLQWQMRRDLAHLAFTRSEIVPPSTERSASQSGGPQLMGSQETSEPSERSGSRLPCCSSTCSALHVSRRTSLSVGLLYILIPWPTDESS